MSYYDNFGDYGRFGGYLGIGNYGRFDHDYHHGYHDHHKYHKHHYHHLPDHHESKKITTVNKYIYTEPSYKYDEAATLATSLLRRLPLSSNYNASYIPYITNNRNYLGYNYYGYNNYL